MDTKICLVLTEQTLEKNLKLLDEYRDYIDIAELRVDFLQENEVFDIRRFPTLANIPIILTVRRVSDGGRCSDGEGARITTFARGLAFADTNPKNNFAYIDIEHDFDASSIEEVAKAFNIKIIRSMHNINRAIVNVADTMDKIRRYDDDIVKLAFETDFLDDVTNTFREVKKCSGPYVLSAFGRCSLPVRILASKLGSEIVYTFSRDFIKRNHAETELMDPISLNQIYRFRDMDENTRIYGLLGKDVSMSKSPIIHNNGYRRKKLNSVYIPINANTIKEGMNFAEELQISGLSITSPFKVDVIPYADELDKTTRESQSMNTLFRENGKWLGFNTDMQGFTDALLECLNCKTLNNMNVAVIGAGGVANSVVFALKKLGANVCVFNRTAEHAIALAKRYNCKWGTLHSGSLPVLEKYSDVIIQTTIVGSSFLPNKDPLAFYPFKGHENVFDLIYEPEETPLLARAKRAGCMACNGYRMLELQAFLQFKIFTGRSYD